MRLSHVCFVTLVCSLLLCGCGQSEEDMNRAKEYCENAEKVTTEYLNAKYGFVPTIKNVENCVDFMLFGSTPTDYCIVEFSDDSDASYYCYIKSNKPVLSETECAYDNYQYEEISSDFKSELEKVAVDSKVFNIMMEYGQKTDYFVNSERQTNMINEYYDGDLSILGGEIVIQGEFTFDDMNNIVDYLSRGFVNLKSEVLSYKEGYAPSENEMSALVDVYDKCSNQSLGINYYTKVTDGLVKEFKSFNTVEAEGVIIVFDSNYQCTISSIEDCIDEASFNGKGFIGAHKVLKDYEVYTDAPYVNVFIPFDMIQTDKTGNTRICVDFRNTNFDVVTTNKVSINDIWYIQAKVKTGTYSSFRFTACIDE